MNEHELLGAPAPVDGSMAHAVLEWGTIGWDSDNASTSFGAGTDDGMTLVKVTLYRGRRPGTGRALQPGLAAGLPIIAHVDARLFQALAAGVRVIVGFPGGDIRTPGNGMILGVAQKSPAAGFDASTMMLPVPDGSTINIGDANADFVALASLVAKCISDLQTAFKLWVVAPQDGGLALKNKLTTAGGWAVTTYKFATTKLKGT